MDGATEQTKRDPSNLDPTKWKARKGEERNRGLGMVAGLMQPTSTGIALQKNRLLIKISFAFLFGNERSVIIGAVL